MNPSISTLLPNDSIPEATSTEYSADECIKRYEFIKGEPDNYASYELDLALERIGNKFLPANSELAQEPDREIVTRIHENSSISQLYPVIDAVSFQDVPNPSTLFTVFAHNLNEKTAAELRKISHRSGDCIRVVEYNDPRIRGAYYSWQKVVLEMHGKDIAMVDSDGYPLPNWSDSMFSLLEANPNLVGASGTLIRVKGGLAYQSYARAVETIRPLLGSNISQSFRAANSVFRKDAARAFAIENAGKLREDGSFAADYKGSIAYKAEALVINDASKFRNYNPEDVLRKGAVALGSKIGKTIKDENFHKLIGRAGFNQYLEGQAQVYAPWTRKVIQSYFTNSESVSFDGIFPEITSLCGSVGMDPAVLRPIFDHYATDGRINDPAKILYFLDDLGSKLYGPIIRGTKEY